jgi:hypothetical protein
VREIRTPHEWIPPAFETVTIVTEDGQKIRGIYDKNSLMPAFDPKRLTDSDLSDLVGHLSTPRGYDVAVR